MEPLTSSMNDKGSHAKARNDDHPVAQGAIATRAEAIGTYIRENGVSDMTRDFSKVIARNPVRSVAIAVGVGLLAGRFLRRG